MLTAEKLRAKLRDYCEKNYLLDAEEFTLEEIETAIQDAIDLFNEFPPELSRKYTVEDFPSDYHLARGAVGNLYRVAAANYRRNQLQYTAGGVAVNDQAKSPEYETIADKYLNEYKQWIILKKREIQSYSLMFSL